MNKNIYMIGIKGSGMSALAQLLHDMGYKVSGSDIDKRFFTQVPLEERGIEIYSFDAKNIKEDAIVVASSAYGNDNVEISECAKKGIEVNRYHEFLGEFAKNFESVAITGTHGKTSTTGLLGQVLSNQKKTTVLIGDGTGKTQQDSEFFAFEACEYKRHFLNYYPNYSIITNIDFDHPDYFSGIEDVKSAFQSLVNQTKKGVVAYGDDKNITSLSFPNEVIFYGLDETNDLRATSIRVENGLQTFDVYYKNNSLGTYKIKQFGQHSVLNTLAVIGVGLLVDLQQESLKSSLLDFNGVKRRFNEEIIGNKVLVDDYAHHPTEIKATINAARSKYADRKVVAVFQSHTFSRTIAFKQDFIDALNLADESYVCPIFASAREKEQKFDLNDFVSGLKNGDILTVDTIEKIDDNDHKVVYLFMGAGNIDDYLKAFKSYLNTQLAVL